MTLLQDLKKFGDAPIMKISANPAEDELNAMNLDYVNLLEVISKVLTSEPLPPEYGTYFLSRNEYADKNVIFTKNIFHFLENFNPNLPENKEIAQNLAEIYKFFRDNDNRQLFRVIPRNFNIRINLEAAIAKAITEPHIKFDSANPYRKVWILVLQEYMSNQNNELTR